MKHSKLSFRPSRRPRRRIAAGGLAVVAAVVLAACGSSSKTATPATTAATASPATTAVSSATTAASSSPGVASSSAALANVGTPETASVTSPLIASSAAEGFYVYGAKAGIYKKYGLSVSTPNSDAGQLKTSFIGGDAQIAELSGADVVNVYASGFPVEVIGCNASAPSGSPAAFQVYSRGAASSVADLKGKTIGTTSLGSTHDVSTEIFLAAHGLQPSEYTQVPLGSVPNILAALESGRIDAGALSYPFSAKAAADSNLHHLGGAAEPDIETVVNANWAKKNANTITAFLAGNLEALASYSTNETQALPILATFLNEAATTPTVKAGYELYKPPNTVPITTCSSSVLTPYLPYLTASEQAAAKKTAGIFNNSYLNTLASDGFYAKLKSTYGSIPGFPAS